MRWFRVLAVSLSVFAWSLSGAAAEGVGYGKDETPLTLGVLAFRPVPETMERWQPLASYISHSLDGRPVELVAANYADLEKALAANRLDFVLTNPSHYIELRSRNALSGALATVIVEEQGHGLTGFGGVIFTRRERGDIDGLGDVKGKSVAAVGSGSLGGFRAQAGELLGHGVRLPGDAEFLFTGMPHDKVVDAVLSGRADAGFVRTGIIEQMVREGRLDPARVKILGPRIRPGFPFMLSTRLYPEWPFVVLPQVDRDVARRVAAALLLFTPDDTSAARVGIKGFAVPADYAVVEDLARALRLPPYDAAPDFMMADVWARYRPMFLGGLVVLAVMSGLGLWLVVFSRRLATSQKLLAVERKRLADIIWGTGVGTWEWNVQTGETRFNERWAGIIGFRLDELAPIDINTWTAYAHPEDLERSGSALERHFAGETDHYECEARMRHKDGHWVWVLDRGKVVERIPDGKPLWMAGTHADITRSKEAELALGERERLFSEFADAADLAFWVRTDAKMLYVSPGYERIWGRPRADLFADPNGFVNSVHLDDRQRIVDALTREFHDQDRFNQEYRIVRPDGAVRWVHAQSWPVLVEGGRLVRSIGTAVDITARKWNELEIKRINLRMAAIFNSAGEGIFGLDTHGNTMFANQATLRMLGWSAEEIQGQNHHALTRHTRADGAPYPAEECPIRRASRDGRTVDITDEVFWRKDGSSFPVEYVATPLIDADGAVSGSIVVFRSVSERVGLLEALAVSNAELERFAYVVSHDLRQPLRMINSFTTLLDRRLGDGLDDEGREFMGFIRDGATRMDKMLVALLEYSKVGRKGQPMTEMAARRALDDALLFLKPDIDETGAEISILGAWPMVSASGDELTRLFQNLIGNALKYRDAEVRPAISVAVEDGGAEWRFEVRDNGIGIDPAQADRLFQVFQRLHGTDKYEGTGIGLAVCRKIVERHGGRIWVASEGEGRGSAFLFTLPKIADQGEAST